MPPRNSLRGVFLILVTVLVAACGGGGDSGTASVPAAPTLTLAAKSVAVGSSTTLTWSSIDATSCTASGNWGGTLATSGSKTITPSAVGTFTYTLACANSAGSSKTSSATLAVDADQVPAAPTLTVLTASPIYAETSASIAWNSESQYFAAAARSRHPPILASSIVSGTTRRRNASGSTGSRRKSLAPSSTMMLSLSAPA